MKTLAWKNILAYSSVQAEKHQCSGYDMSVTTEIILGSKAINLSLPLALFHHVSAVAER